MTEQELLDACGGILSDLLTDDSIVLTMSTTRDDVPRWDSLAYVNFIVMVELQFGVKFRLADVESFEDVGAIVRRLQALLSTR